MSEYDSNSDINYISCDEHMYYSTYIIDNISSQLCKDLIPNITNIITEYLDNRVTCIDCTKKFDHWERRCDRCDKNVCPICINKLTVLCCGYHLYDYGVKCNGTHMYCKECLKNIQCAVIQIKDYSIFS